MATIQQLPSGNWRVQWYTNAPDGTRIRKSATAPTRWEAEKLAAEHSDNIEHLTVAQALDGYIAIKKNVLSPSTIYGYQVIRRNRLQSIMDVDIHKLNSVMLQSAINEDAVHIGRKSISEAKNLIMTALKLYGVRTEFNVTLPPKKPQIKNLPTPAQVIQLVRGTDIELPCMLALWLSLRISEVRGLQFGDLKDGVLTVQRSKLALANRDVVREVNKTYTSTRKLALPPYLIGLIQAIPHTSDEEFIVPMSYQAIRAHLTKLARAKGYTLTFHQLRHLNASVMLSLGVPDKYAMERGGWATNSTLKNVYQHTFSEERQQVDKMIDRYFEDALNETEE